MQSTNLELYASLESEEAYIASLLKNPDSVFEATLDPNCLYFPNHKTVYSAIKAIAESQKKVDFYSVTDFLQDRNQYQAIGGYTYFKTIREVAVTKDLESLELIILRKWQRREIEKACYQILDETADIFNQDVDEILSHAQSLFKDIADNTRSRNTTRSTPQIVSDFEAEVENAPYQIMSSGIDAIDRICDGLPSSGLTIIGAMSGTGKTFFACNLLKHISDRISDYKYPGVFFSSEMSGEKILERYIMGITKGIPSKAIAAHNYTLEQKAELKVALDEIRKWHIVIDDTDGSDLTISKMRSVLYKVQREYGGVSLVVQDYLQLLGDRSGSNRHGEIGKISSQMKAIAKEFRIPFVALAQLKQGVNDKSELPDAGDIRDSGEIRQDADLIVTMRASESKLPIVSIDLNIAKNRRGKSGVTRVLLDRSKGVFVNG